MCSNASTQVYCSWRYESRIEGMDLSRKSLNNHIGILLPSISLGAAKSLKCVLPGSVFPFGMERILREAGTCFCACVGFYSIAATGEEAQNPPALHPCGPCDFTVVYFLVCFGVSSAFTVMMPGYQLHPESPMLDGPLPA